MILFTHYKDDYVFSVEHDGKEWQYVYKPYSIQYYSKSRDNERTNFKAFDGVTYLEKSNYFRGCYNDINPKYSYLYENQSKGDIPDANIAYLDIEAVGFINFNELETSTANITSIAYLFNKINYVFSVCDYDNKRSDVTYVKCANEKELLVKFLMQWRQHKIHIITGWNVEGFDLPYMYNRIKAVLGEQYCNYLISCFKNGIIKKGFHGNLEYYGLEVLDYRNIIKDNPSYKPANYKLDTVGKFFEVGEKLDYTGTLTNLFETDQQKYIDYNIMDCELVHAIDTKVNEIKAFVVNGILENCNPSDANSSSTLWDVIIYNHYRSIGLFIPPNKPSVKETYQGALIKKPITGHHENVVTLDVNSMYPNSAIQFNISPDTLLDDNSNCKNKVTLPNGVSFSLDKQGVIPKLMKDRYNERVSYKEDMKKIYKILDKISKLKAS